MTPEDILRLVQEEGAIILFDGLDEKIVHLPPAGARNFIRRLWAVLPDTARGGDPLPPGSAGASCSSPAAPIISGTW